MMTMKALKKEVWIKDTKFIETYKDMSYLTY